MNYSDILLTVDFDRTLTAPDSSVPQRNLEAIRYFMDRGGAFTINTGRSVPMARQNIIGRVPVNAPLLLYNGSAAYDAATGRLSQVHPIGLDAKSFLQDLMERFPEVNVEIHGIDAHHMLRKSEPWERFCQHNSCAWAYAGPEDIPQPFIKVAVNGQFREPTIASMYQASSRELALFDRVSEYIEARYGGAIQQFRACARILDLHARGCSKLRAARELQQQLGRKILVCVGDAENDLTMLRGADYAYCPSDGAVAHLFENVCGCGQGAVADVIYEKIPGILKNNS